MKSNKMVHAVGTDSDSSIDIGHHQPPPEACVSLQQRAPRTFWGTYGSRGSAPNPAGVATAAPCTLCVCECVCM